jgi:hypothetical protein
MSFHMVEFLPASGRLRLRENSVKRMDSDRGWRANARGPGGVRYRSKNASEPPDEDEILEVLPAMARLLERLGHEVEEAAPEWDAELLGTRPARLRSSASRTLLPSSSRRTGSP